MRENRVVAISDANGNALVTHLVPDADNHLSVDPTDFPISVILNDPERTVVPPRASGVIVDMAPKEEHPAIITAHLQDGSPPPSGAGVSIDGVDGLLVVGRQGEIYVGDLARSTNGEIDTGNGHCRFSVDVPPDAPNKSISRIGPVLCTSETPG
jgi:outer membrane usher protein